MFYNDLSHEGQLSFAFFVKISVSFCR